MLPLTCGFSDVGLDISEPLPFTEQSEALPLTCGFSDSDV